MKTITPLLASLACFCSMMETQAANVYQTTVTGQSPAVYFKLDNSYVDSVSGSLMLVTNNAKQGFTNDIFGSANSAALYTASNMGLFCSNNIINGAAAGPDTGDTATSTGSITLLFKMLTITNNTGQRFLFSQGTTVSTDNELGLFLEDATVGNGDPNSLKLRVGTTSATIITNQFLQPGAWYYFAMTYDESRDSGEVLWWVGPVGGTMLTGTMDLNNIAVVADSSVDLTIGNKSGPIGGTNYTAAWRNTGNDNGVIDEFAVWDRELSTSEITAQFNAANGNAPAPASPQLSVASSGKNVLLSWTTNNTAGFALQSSPALPASWTAVGAATSIVGTNYVVTNSISGPGNNFYRLQHP